MGKKRRFILLGALTCISALSCVNAKLRSPTEGGAQWTQIETENFRLLSDLKPAEAESIAKQLELDLSALSQAAFKSANPIVEGTDVILFSQSAHFHHFAPSSVQGFFYRPAPLSSETRHTVVTYGHLDEATRTTLMHELTHDLFARNFGPAPAWLNEGWAQYYSTARATDGKLRVGGALPSLTFTDEAQPFTATHNGMRLLAMPISEVLPPSALTAMSSEAFYRFSNRPEPTFDEHLEESGRYLGAWAFVHMLIDGDSPYAHRFNTFLDLVRTKSVEDAWTRAFQGIDPSQMDRAFRSYLFERQLAVFTIPFREHGKPKVSHKHTLSDGEVHTLWARLHLARLTNAPDALAEAKTELDAALKSEPRRADTFYYRGLLALRSERLDQAAIAFAQATRLAPEEPRFLFAQLSLEFTRQGGSPSSAQASPLRASVEALARMADSAPALLLPAHYFLASGERERALALGQRALSYNPVEPEVLHSYALLLEGAGRIKEALVHQRRAVALLNDDQRSRARLLAALRRMEAISSSSAPSATRSTRPLIETEP